MNYADRLTDKAAQDFASKAGDLFSSLPHLPKGLVEFFVKIAPYLALIGAVLSLFSSPFLALVSVLSLITLNPILVVSVVVATVLSVVSAVILFMAYKPLQAHSYNGWMLLFWSNVLGLVQVILNVLLQQSNLGGLIGAAIGFYVLYEMRPWYGVKGKLEDAKSK